MSSIKLSNIIKRTPFLLVSFTFFLATINHSYGQNRKLISGGLVGLKGTPTCNITFEYDSLTVGGLNKPEQKYLEEKKKAWDIKNPSIAGQLIQ